MKINNTLFISSKTGFKLKALIEDLGIAFFTFSNASNVEEPLSLTPTTMADKFTQITYSKSSNGLYDNVKFSECFLSKKNTLENNCNTHYFIIIIRLL